jgi:hypothetical protein
MIITKNHVGKTIYGDPYGNYFHGRHNKEGGSLDNEIKRLVTFTVISVKRKYAIVDCGYRKTVTVSGCEDFYSGYNWYESIDEFKEAYLIKINRHDKNKKPPPSRRT